MGIFHSKEDEPVSESVVTDDPDDPDEPGTCDHPDVPPRVSPPVPTIDRSIQAFAPKVDVDYRVASDPEPYDRDELTYERVDEVPTLADRPLDTVYKVALGDAVAYFCDEDRECVIAILALTTQDASSLSLSKRVAQLIRLRVATEIVVRSADLTTVAGLERVAEMFHTALEPDPDGVVTSKELEDHLWTLMPPPDRYGPFADLAGAVEFMCLPVEDNCVRGFSLRVTALRETPLDELRAAGRPSSIGLVRLGADVRRLPRAPTIPVALWNAPATIRQTGRGV